jgi:pilus assembly protein Flp/PilA
MVIEIRIPHSPRYPMQSLAVALRFLSPYFAVRAKTERGASLVEYALLVALIAVVCIAAVTTLGKSASSKFTKVGSSIGA